MLVRVSRYSDSTSRVVVRSRRKSTTYLTTNEGNVRLTEELRRHEMMRTRIPSLGGILLQGVTD